MNLIKRENLLKCLKLLDLLLMVSAFSLAAWITHYQIEQVSFEELVTFRMKVQNFILFMSIGWVWLWAFSSFGLYEPFPIVTRKTETFGVLKATTAGTAIILIDSYLFEIELITTTFLCLFWLLSSIFSISSRILFKYLFNKFLRSSYVDNTDGIYSKKAFQKIIEKERIRANRDNHIYSILLFRLDLIKQNGNDLGILLQTIAGRVRKIDEIGWYDDYRIGVILPYTSMQGACKLAEFICESMKNISKKPECDVYTYPFNKRLLAQDKSTKTLSVV
jgi:hypothetical protein